MKKLILFTFLLINIIYNSFAQTTGLRFDGLNDYVFVAHNNAYDLGTGNFTLEAIVNLDATQTALNYPAVISNRLSSGTYVITWLWYARALRL